MESLDGPNVLEKLCHHAALLGLRNPTEQSVATLLTLSFDTHGLLLGSEKWSLMQQRKDYIKRQLGKEVDNALCICFDSRKIQKNYLRSCGCVPSQARRQLF